MKLRIAPLVLAFVAFSTVGSFAQSQWPMFQADEAHHGYLPVAIDVSSIKLRWQKSVSTKALNPVTTSGDKVFVTEKVYFVNGSLIALDPADGSVAWSKSLGAPFSINPPSYANGSVYVQTCDNASDTWLRCYDAATGSQIFLAPHGAQWENYLAPTVKDGVVYIDGGSYGGMYAFDGASGAQLWFSSLAQYDQWTPALDADHAFAYVGGVLTAVKRSDGTHDYEITDPNFSWQGWSMSLAPVLGDLSDALVIYNGRLVSFDLLNRKVGWELAGSFTGQPSVHGGVIYAVDGGTLWSIDEATGSRQWSWADVGKTLVGQPIITDSHVFVHNATRVHAVDPIQQKSVWNYVASGAMSLGVGALFLAGSDGTVTALEYAQLPSPHSIDPPRQRFYEPPAAVTIHGSGFDDGTTPIVQFNGLDATNVVVVDDATITCTAPSDGPGQVDVLVQNTIGPGSLKHGFINLPAVGLDGTLALGQTVDLTYYTRAGDEILALAGLPPQTSIPTPPFAGTLAIFPFQIFFLMVGWPFEDLKLELDIPNDPSLSGVTFELQALVGPKLVGIPKEGAWSNCLEVTIQ